MNRSLAIYGGASLLTAAFASILYLFGVKQSSDMLLYLGGFVAVVLVAALWIDPIGLFVILLGFLPFSFGLFRFEIGVVTFSPYTLGLLACLPVAGYRAFLGGQRYSLRVEDVVITMLGLTFLVSTLKSADIHNSGYLLFHTLFIPAVTYFVARSLLTDRTHFRNAMVFLLAGIGTFASYALVEFVSNPVRIDVLRIPPISAAALFTVGIIMIVYTEFRRSWFAKLTLVVIAASLLATLSRGFLVLLIVSPMIYFMIRRGKAVALLVAMLIATLAATLWLSFIPMQTPVARVDVRMEKTIDRVINLDFWKASVLGRVQLYREGLESFRESPVFGKGYHSENTELTGRPVVWHNFHIEWLEFGGLVGYFLYSSLLMGHFWVMRLAARSDRFIAAGLLAIFLVLTNGLTNGVSVGTMPYILFLLMGLNHARLRLTEGKSSAPARVAPTPSSAGGTMSSLQAPGAVRRV